MCIRDRYMGFSDDESLHFVSGSYAPDIYFKMPLAEEIENKTTGSKAEEYKLAWCENHIVALALPKKIILAAACFEIDAEVQRNLLKAYTFARNSLVQSKDDSDNFVEILNKVKALTALREEAFKRTMTYRQLDKIDQTQFIKILLRYQLHYLAFEICNLLNYNLKVRAQIVTHWACCALEVRESDDVICMRIIQKLKNEKNISYTDIAARAFTIGKESLAVKLLEYEPRFTKRVPVFLKMRNYEKAIEEAIKSCDFNLIELCLHTIVKSFSEPPEVFDLMAHHPFSLTYMIHYYRDFYLEEYQNLHDYLGRREDYAFYLVRKAYNYDEIEERKEKLIKAASKFRRPEQKPNEDSPPEQALKQQIQLYDEIISRKAYEFSRLTIQQFLDEFLKIGDEKGVQDLQRVFRISDRRFTFSRLKSLAHKNKWGEFEALVMEKNKKNIVIPWEDIAELCHKAGQAEKAEMFLSRLPKDKVDEQVQCLKLLDRWERACDVCVQFRRPDLLMEMRAQTDDETILGRIEIGIESLSTQRKQIYCDTQLILVCMAQICRLQLVRSESVVGILLFQISVLSFNELTSDILT
eukprot:TRINITY_DN1963_c0_g2_i3.p1 TRINITY_DN1963_c0_g2~~TRINITY_DN1963_c0_g2_i3.p1  ORF type:complete len:581 (+),score=133.09 TRINITY_DN1963_c0_g2_i3:112-1854(+)